MSLLIAGLCLVMTAGITVHSVRRDIASASATLENKSRAYAQFAAQQLEPAIAFRDLQTAREVATALRLDSDVETFLLLDDERRVLVRVGLGEPPTLGAGAGSAEEQGLWVVAPIVAKEGARGTLALRLSGDSIRVARTSAMRAAGAVGAVALVLALLGAWLITRPLSRRLGGLTRVAHAVARGDHSNRPEQRGASDEVGTLAGAFGSMLDQLRDLMSEREAAAASEKERLDGLVATRTADLEARNGELRSVLDQIGDGIATIDGDGLLGAEHSRMLATWFGVPAQGASLSSYFERFDPRFAGLFEAAWSGVIDDILPLEVCLDQLPRSLRFDGRTYEVSVQAMQAALSRRFLVVVRDVTAELERGRAKAAERDLASSIKNLIADRDGFTSQLNETETLVTRIVSAEVLSPTLRRDLHTLKGNSAMLGLASITELCHVMEEFIAETQDAPTPALRASLVGHWKSIAEPLSSLRENRDRLTVDRSDLERLRRGILEGEAKLMLVERVRALSLEPIRTDLERFARYAVDAAVRSNKEIEVSIHDGGVLIDPVRFAPFWSSFVHVVRNAVSHGIEGPEAREDQNKSRVGQLSLRASRKDDAVVIEVSDDGAGVAWEKVREKARTHGLPHATERDLERALFEGGLSTRDTADELAGRGEGLSAVRDAVRMMGGSIFVLSRAEFGTTFEFVLPMTSLRSSGRPTRSDAPARSLQ